MSPDPDYQIYLIRHEHGFVKIGKSIDPERRYRDIRSYSPYTLELHTTLDGYDESEESRTSDTVETLLHHYYDRCCRKFEWFDLPESEIRALTELDSIYATDLEVMMYDFHVTPFTEPDRTIRDNLHTVWSLRARMEDPAGAMQEVDR